MKKIPEELAVLRDAREAEAGISFDVAVRRFLRAEQRVVDKILEKYREGYFRVLVPVGVVDERFLVIRSAVYGQDPRGRWDGGGISGSIFHCFVDQWTGDVLPHAGWGYIAMNADAVSHVFGASNGAGYLSYMDNASPYLVNESIVRDKGGAPDHRILNSSAAAPWRVRVNGEVIPLGPRESAIQTGPLIPTLPHLQGMPRIPVLPPRQTNRQPTREQTSFAKKQRRQARRR